MTFFIGRENCREEEAENMASNSSASPLLIDEEMIARIQQEDKIHSFLEGIGLRPIAKKEATQALTRVIERNHEVAAIKGSLMQVAYQEAKDSVTFSNKDLVNRTIDVDRPLCVTTFVGASQIKRALVDTDASTNILPLPTFVALGIPRERIITEPIQVVGVGALQQNTLRHFSLDLRVRPIRTPTLMHIIEGNTSYHLILGCPWLRAYKAMTSTYHQCVKAIWRNKHVVIEATKMPFNRVELHFTEAALYQEYEPKGENWIFPFNPIALQVKEEDDGEVVDPKRPSKMRKVSGPNGRVVYEF